ncbi:hypothetical protein [Larkinella ripae]
MTERYHGVNWSEVEWARTPTLLIGPKKRAGMRNLLRADEFSARLVRTRSQRSFGGQAFFLQSSDNKNNESANLASGPARPGRQRFFRKPPGFGPKGLN